MEKRVGIKQGIAGAVLAAAGFAGGVAVVDAPEGVTPVREPLRAETAVCERWVFPFDPHDTTDGDTVTGRVELGMGVSRVVKVRLFGIDAPESRGKSKAAGLEAKAFTYEWLRAGDDFELRVEPKARDKYGRTLGDICTRDGCLAHALRKAGHAKEYDGGAK